MEYDILKTFPFDEYHINLITVGTTHHTLAVNSTKIKELLESNDFEFVKGNDDIHNWGHGPIEDFYKNKNIVVTDQEQGTTVKVVQYILDD